jgi:hypothetical protein
VKIYVQPRNGDSFQRAVSILRDAEISSAKAGDSDTLLIDLEDTPVALATLERAGVRQNRLTRRARHRRYSQPHARHLGPCQWDPRRFSWVARAGAAP